MMVNRMKVDGKKIVSSLILNTSGRCMMVSTVVEGRSFCPFFWCKIHQILRCLRTRGAPNILFEVIWLDIQIWVGTPHIIQRTSLFELLYDHFLIFLCFRWVGGGFETSQNTFSTLSRHLQDTL